MIGKEMIKVLNVYFKEDIRVHISCDNRFYNGNIISIDSENNIICFNDDMLGDLPIVLDKIDIIEPFKEKKNG